MEGWLGRRERGREERGREERREGGKKEGYLPDECRDEWVGGWMDR